MYRMLYTAIPVGTYLQRAGNFGNYATSPVLTWDSLEEAMKDADWQQTTIITGYFSIIDKDGKEVYRAQEEKGN